MAGRDQHQPLAGPVTRADERAQEAHTPASHCGWIDQDLEGLAGGTASRVDDEVGSMPTIIQPSLHARREQVALADDRQAREVARQREPTDIDAGGRPVRAIERHVAGRIVQETLQRAHVSATALGCAREHAAPAPLSYRASRVEAANAASTGASSQPASTTPSDMPPRSSSWSRKPSSRNAPSNLPL